MVTSPPGLELKKRKDVETKRIARSNAQELWQVGSRRRRERKRHGRKQPALWLQALTQACRFLAVSFLSIQDLFTGSHERSFLPTDLRARNDTDKVRQQRTSRLSRYQSLDTVTEETNAGAFAADGTVIIVGAAVKWSARIEWTIGDCEIASSA